MARPGRQQPRRASVVGAGSFGTAVAIVLERAGLRTTLLCRTPEQAERLNAERENARYLAGVRLPERLKLRALGGRDDQFHRSDLVFVAVPSAGIEAAIAELMRQGVSARAGVVSLTKGLVPPDGTPPTVALERAFGPERVACVGGPAHAREMVEGGAGLICASHSPGLAERVAEVFRAGRIVCEASGDLVATALAPSSRNRSAGELLAQGVPASEIPERLGQAVEALETVSLLARAIERAGVSAPITSALARLIAGSLPLDEWVALVRVSQPEPRRRAGRVRVWWLRVRAR